MQNKLNSLSEQEQSAAILKDVADNGTFAEYCIAIDGSYQMEWFHAEIAEKLKKAIRDSSPGKMSA